MSLKNVVTCVELVETVSLDAPEARVQLSISELSHG